MSEDKKKTVPERFLKNKSEAAIIGKEGFIKNSELDKMLFKARAEGFSKSNARFETADHERLIAKKERLVEKIEV